MTPELLAQYLGVVITFFLIFAFGLNLSIYYWEKFHPTRDQFKECWFCPLTAKERAIKINFENEGN